MAKFRASISPQSENKKFSVLSVYSLALSKGGNDREHYLCQYSSLITSSLRSNSFKSQLIFKPCRTRYRIQLMLVAGETNEAMLFNNSEKTDLGSRINILNFFRGRLNNYCKQAVQYCCD